ncbi:hypothetical protein [Puniceibacterium sp. IMCC21224]|uniref:hypothetical protein n=1 Tax=Puniceibacterium sp. IMCC21224 TaxID=1618204 RepID=UPI00064D80BB|nr:hypothetical protein [Puniceibacterium sp. IMCC21224]KMK66333.1 hypothetical protein IMCC21224_111183 [Puniceibacterium sp. IMCC21224]
MTEQRILAEVRASAPRRVIGVGMLLFLGGLLIFVALDTPPTIGWQIFLVVIGLAALWLAGVMYQATKGVLSLTATELRDSDGTVLARIDEISKIDRGMFAMKPSNGFTLLLNRPQARCWRPGLWWRLGRRVAVGGVTPGSQTKPMADVIAALVSGQLNDGQI